MLYILLILLFLLLLVGGHFMCFCGFHNFNLQETLPLRGILAICVMLTHLCPYLEKEAPLLSDFGLWGPPSVASFFFLAGYGLSISYHKKGVVYLHGFFRKRFMRLLWPLLVMTIVYQCYKLFIGTFDINSLLAEPSPKTWFIYALVVWYVGFYLSFKLGKNRGQRLSFVWLFALLYIAFTVWQRLACYYVSILPLPMAITYVYYEHRVKNFISHHQTNVWLVMMLVILIVMAYSVAGQYGVKLPGWGFPVNILVPCVLVYVTYYLGGWKNRVTNLLGKISYEFYIVHGFVVMQLGGTHLFGLKGYANAFGVIVVVLVVTVFFAWLMNLVCARISVGK